MLRSQSSVYRGKKERKTRAENVIAEQRDTEDHCNSLLLLLGFVVDKNGRTECPPSYLLHDFILLHPGLHSPFCIRSFAAVGSTTTVRALLSTLLGCHQKHVKSSSLGTFRLVCTRSVFLLLQVLFFTAALQFITSRCFSRPS